VSCAANLESMTRGAGYEAAGNRQTAGESLFIWSRDCGAALRLAFNTS
jgi:hypothetical protein